MCELFGDNFHDDWEVSPGVTEHHHRSSSDDGTGTPAERIRKAHSLNQHIWLTLI